jgi:hypothetical protein
VILTPPVLHLFGRQRGVAADIDLLQLMTPRQLERAMRQGLISTELPHVRRLAGTEADRASRVMALSQYAGEYGFVSGMTAAREHGVECVPFEYYELMIHECRAPMLPKWVKVTRSSWMIEEHRMWLADGRLVSNPLRTLFRCGQTGPQVRFERSPRRCGIAA